MDGEGAGVGDGVGVGVGVGVGFTGAGCSQAARIIPTEITKISMICFLNFIFLMIF
ncbi:MAG: hypothetical protein N3D19_00485 [Archaeoglobaceae archaeon]|nr:hypothetical protein [Archaeoglobaceae archaeon]